MDSAVKSGKVLVSQLAFRFVKKIAVALGRSACRLQQQIGDFDLIIGI